jgi:hypothetical protein
MIWKRILNLISVVQVNFVQTVRAVELALGIPIPGINSPSFDSAGNATSALSGVSTLASIFNSEVRQVLHDAIPILAQVAKQLGLNMEFAHGGLASILKARQPLVTTYVDMRSYIYEQ